MNQIPNQENFADLLNEQIAKNDFAKNPVCNAKIEVIADDVIVVSAGLKSEGRIPKKEFLDSRGQLEKDIEVGNEVEVFVERIEDGTGKTVFSREKAKRIVAWRNIEEAFETQKSVIGVITERVRGGFGVEIDKVKAFLPGSLLDVKPIQDPSYLERRELDFKVIKIDKKQNNIVVSRRAVLLAEGDTEKLALLQNLHEGDVVEGVVKNLTDYGAFVDLGGVDGLLHITDISWKRIRHPSEALQVGGAVKVKILKFDSEKARVSLGMKQLIEDPWQDIDRRYPRGARLFGKVTNLTEYGGFVEIEPGIEGLVHVSEMDWTNKNINPSKILKPGQEIEVMVLEIDPERRRISLGIKQCQQNPWAEFSLEHKKGDIIIGKVKSVTDFGVFVGLDGAIDGLIHVSDLGWEENGEALLANYKKGQEVQAVIIAIDAERERISLGIKQLERDIYTDYLDAHPRGSIVTGKVKSVTPKEVLVTLTDAIEGKMRAADVSLDKVQDATQYLNVDDEIEAKVMGMDKKGRYVNLSIRALHVDLSEEEGPLNTAFGDLLKEHMEDMEEDKE